MSETEDFLRLVIAPGTFMTVVVIHPETGVTKGKAFQLETIPLVVKWLAKHKDWNQYWGVNPLAKAINKKPEKADVAEIRLVHCDADTDESNTLQEIESRIRAYPLKPTFLIFSGGGYGVFWKVRSPVRLDRNVDALEAANRRVLQDLDPGHPGTHNLDRLMRLPGTMNWPTKTKLAKGRKPVESKLIEYHKDREYDLSDFGVPAVDVPGVQAGAVNLDDLRLSKTLLYAIENGDRKSEPFLDRSRAMHWACAEMARQDIPPEVARKILMRHKIGDHARDQSDPERALDRTFQKTYRLYNERAAQIQQLNAEFATVFIDAKIVVILKDRWIHALPKMRDLASLKTKYLNKMIDENNPIDLWLKNPNRVDYEDLVFRPGVADVGKDFNLFTGWSIAPKNGDCSLILGHMRDILCDGDESLFKFVLAWFAAIIQHPMTLTGTALTMGSIPGAGKGALYRYIRTMMQRYCIQLNGSQILTDTFNDYIAARLLVFGDETLWHGDKRTISRVKGLITEETVLVNRKHIPAFEVDNLCRYIFATNDDQSAPIEKNDRRFVVLPVSNRRVADVRYWKALEYERTHGGAEALLHHFMHEVKVDIDSLRKAPENAARAQQRVLNLDLPGEWWRLMLVNRRNVSSEVDRTQEPPVPVASMEFGGICRVGDLHVLFSEYAKRQGRRGTSIDGLGRALKDFANILKREPRADEKRALRIDMANRGTAVYELQPLEDARKYFEEKVGITLDWDANCLRAGEGEM